MNRKVVVISVLGAFSLVSLYVLNSYLSEEPPDVAPAADSLSTRAEEPLPAAPPVAQANNNTPPATAEPVDALLGRWLTLQDEDQVQAAENELLTMGEAAVRPIIARLDAPGATPAARDRLFNLMRRLPGPQVEARMIEEAVRGKQNSTRTMAFESLGQLKTPKATAALADVALSDPDVPAKPLIAEPRNPNDPSTELPDEQVFTPRMKAMTALANNGTPKAVVVLSDIARTGPDESLRLEAARNLGLLRDNPQALDTLRVAAASDPSPYVRLSALHALQGAKDPSLAAVLERIASNDVDLGVRTLAAQVAANMRN